MDGIKIKALAGPVYDLAIASFYFRERDDELFTW